MKKTSDRGRPGSIRDALIQKVKEIYRVEPEHPFRTAPDAVVFRHSDNRKWFGLIMTVKNSALAWPPRGGGAGVPASEAGIPAGEADILDVKLDPFLVGNLRTQRGYHPAYHMNHDSWLSVRLDGSVPIETILPLIDMSFELTAPAALMRGRERTMRVAGQSWIIPANPANYDVAAGFKREGTLVWHIRPRVLPGDYVYIYETLPIGAILFKCEVVEADIPYSNPMFPGATRAMRIKLLRQYDEGLIDRQFMRDHGVANVRSARLAPPRLVRAIAELERENAGN